MLTSPGLVDVAAPWFHTAQAVGHPVAAAGACAGWQLFHAGSPLLHLPILCASVVLPGFSSDMTRLIMPQWCIGVAHPVFRPEP